MTRLIHVFRFLLRRWFEMFIKGSCRAESRHSGHNEKCLDSARHDSLFTISHNRLNKYVFSLMMVVLVTSCTSPEKLYNQGNYDQAMNEAIDDLQKDPSDEQAAKMLIESYAAASQQNLSEIDRCRKTGDPSYWYPIYQNYKTLWARQTYVQQSLPESTLDKIDFVKRDYRDEMEEAGQKAATYFYVRAKNNLEIGKQEDAGQAYNDLLKVKEIYEDYRSTDALLRKALMQSYGNVLYKVRNQTGNYLPDHLMHRLQNINFYGKEQYFNFDKAPAAGRTYKLLVQLNVTSAKLTPAEITETEKGIMQKVRSKSRTKIDSAGNRVPVPEFQMIECRATEMKQHKTATISGYVDFVDIENEKLLYTVPVSGESIFSNEYYKDINCPEGYTMKAGEKLEFPSDNELIMDAAAKLRETVKMVILPAEKNNGQ